MFNDPINAFKGAMAHAGLLPNESIKPDGRLHRFKVKGDKLGSKNGFYGLHLDHRPAGFFGSWKTGVTHSWRADGMPLTSLERNYQEIIIREARVKSQKERRKQQEDFAVAARDEFGRSTPADCNHPYLLTKQVGPHKLRQLGCDLLVPLRDWFGVIWNVQHIDPVGQKRFRRGRAKGLFSCIGVLNEPSKLIICEGWATGATLYQYYKVPILCAMNAGNLEPVAYQASFQFRDAEITIAADNDTNTAGNPGLTKAIEACRWSGAKLLVPHFPKGVAGTDFNDFAKTQPSVWKL